MLNLIVACALFVLGACFGSFINVVALRLPKKKSFVGGRSSCTACGKLLKFYELFPLVSWLVQLGRCRGCGVKVSLRYIIVEIICGFLFVVSFVFYGFSFMTVICIAVACILLTISLIDFDTTEIPDGLNIALVPLAIASVFFQPDITILSHVIGFFAVSVPMIVMILIVDGAFGFGDVKLIAVCGFMLGWQNTVFAFFVAVLIGGSFAVYLLARGKRKRKEHMVFGPALCIGIFSALLFGNYVVKWYIGFLMF